MRRSNSIPSSSNVAAPDGAGNIVTPEVKLTELKTKYEDDKDVNSIINDLLFCNICFKQKFEVIETLHKENYILEQKLQNPNLLYTHSPSYCGSHVGILGQLTISDSPFTYYGISNEDEATNLLLKTYYANKTVMDCLYRYVIASEELHNSLKELGLSFTGPQLPITVIAEKYRHNEDVKFIVLCRYFYHLELRKAKEEINFLLQQKDQLQQELNRKLGEYHRFLQGRPENNIQNQWIHPGFQATTSSNVQENHIITDYRFVHGKPENHIQEQRFCNEFHATGGYCSYMERTGRCRFLH